MNPAIKPSYATFTDIKVSVVMITYNHEDFIAQAIDSVIMQQTGFPYELIIGEDCSTDSTRAIVCSYGERYPERIHLLLHQRNLGMIPNFVAALKAARGEYIALLEGDDYWTDPRKLQKQVDFLDAHLDCVLCFHNIYKLFQSTGEMVVEKQKWPRPYYVLEDLIRHHVHVPTASMMFRNGIISEFPPWFGNAPVGDTPLLVLLAQHGKIGLIDQVMSVYRFHGAGVWQSIDASERQQWVDETYLFLEAHLGPHFQKLFKAPVSGHYLNRARILADLGERSRAKIYLKKSFKISFSLREYWIDQLVMLFRLYLPPFYRGVKWLLKDGRFSHGRALQACRNSRFYRRFTTLFH